MLVFVLLFSISCTKTDEVRLGVVLPLTGNISEFGEPMLNGIRLAVDQYNNAGNTPKIHLFIYDGKGDIHVTNNRIKDLISDKVIAIIGPITSATVMNSSILTQKRALFKLLRRQHTYLPQNTRDLFGEYVTRMTIREV